MFKADDMLDFEEGESDDSRTYNTGDYEFKFPLVSQANEELIEGEFGPLQLEDYETFKKDLLSWLHTEGKNTFKGEGYSEDTINVTHYAVEMVFRFLWMRDGDYTTTFPVEYADEFINYLVKNTDNADSTQHKKVKSLKRLFKYYNETKGTEIDWDYENISEIERDDADRVKDSLRTQEMAELIEVAINDASMKSYDNCGPDERDMLKAHLAQRFEKPKAEVGREDFKKATSWKFPSLISLSVDLGLRPIEVERMKVSHLHPDEKLVRIPKEDSSKEKSEWECVMSTRTARMLKEWLDERETKEKYHQREGVWLTKYGNSYNKDNLNPLLDRLLEESSITPQGRQLSWYAIRRGSATMWADKADLKDAKQQLRHQNIKTTARYADSSSMRRTKVIDQMM